MIKKRVKRDSHYQSICRVEHQKLKQVAALSKAEQSKGRNLSNKHIVKAKQTGKLSEARQSTQIKALPP